MSGKGAEARFRHEGKLVSQETFTAARSAQLAAKAKPRKYLEQTVAWQGGLAQARAQAVARAAIQREVRPLNQQLCMAGAWQLRFIYTCDSAHLRALTGGMAGRPSVLAAVAAHHILTCRQPSRCSAVPTRTRRR